MTFAGFSPDAFDVFLIPGFAERMEALRTVVRPTLEALGHDLAPALGPLVGEPLYPHVAKHLRRRVNPPDDTWVAFGPSLRGYKALPHFEAGLSGAGVFCRFVIKPEGQSIKPLLLARIGPADLLALAAGGTCWYAADHGREPMPLAEVGRMAPADWERLRARALRPSEEVAVGRFLGRDEAIRRGAQLVDWFHEGVAHLAPLYRAARASATA
jgi:uncharacterized protein YktB (UPF0637 family)